MDIEKIRTLIELMEEKELLTLEVNSGEDKVKLTRYYEPVPAVVSAPQALTTPLSSQQADSTAPNRQENDLGIVETSPMVGVFYSAPSPNDPPFVKVGQKVQAGDQLGIIEAMKIMNPLEATQSGVIEAILVKNSEVVEFGQPVIRYKS